VLRQSLATLEGELRHSRPSMMVTSVRTRSWLAGCLEELGEFAEGRAYAEEAVRIAEEAAHLGTAIFAQSRLGRLAQRRGDLQHAIPILERALAQCRAAETRLFLSVITSSLGLAYALSGRVAEARPLLEQVEVSEDTALGGLPVMLRVGEAYLLTGCLEEAHALAKRAMALGRAHQERGHQAYALRLLGELARRDSSQVELAAAHFRQALALTEELGMRPLQAHCHLGLGTLHSQTEYVEQARAELSTAIDMYRDMEMTFWLPQAEAALERLKS
jgi:tetratricopeptide (TPR) repeat protein